MIKKELMILRMLNENDELYGLQMIEDSGGKLKRGTIYVYLDVMEDKGLITSYKEEKHPDRRTQRRKYKITELGQLEVAVLQRIEI